MDENSFSFAVYMIHACANRAKSRRLMKLLEKSYDMCAEMTDSEAIFLEKAIDSEKDEDLRDALQEHDDFLRGF